MKCAFLLIDFTLLLWGNFEYFNPDIDGYIYSYSEIDSYLSDVTNSPLLTIIWPVIINP